MTIIIVEDSTLEMQRICRMVHEAEPEARIISFTDSIEAKDLILSHSCLLDVAFLDIEMPAPNGAELARILVNEYPQINIIFTTAYTSYMQQAFSLFVSGYLLKPFSRQDIQKQLQNLRHPLPKDQPAFYAKTLGEFDFFHQGKPLAFPLSKSKEALAYLIDRQGASITKRELFTILFEDTEYSASKQDYMKKIIQALKMTLEQADGRDILIHTRNSYAIDMSKISTDYLDIEHRRGVPYMEQYSWADGWRV